MFSKISGIKKQKTTNLLLPLGCFFLIATIVFACIVGNKFGLINQNEYIGNPDATFAYEDDFSEYGTIDDVEYANSLQSLVKKWAVISDNKLSSKNVVNILLIGEDNDGKLHRSDTAILASINRKTQKIILTSFLRDSYSYIEIGGEDRYDKLNHSYAWGGPEKLVETISNNYKIKIDYYATINFESFVEAIDALGGVRVQVTEEEARYMNRTTKIKGFESGNNVLLDGEHALVFARIRKLDNEVNRTERQRRLISSVINTLKSSSISDINRMVDKFLPYVSTNCSNSKIISLATNAFTEKWYNYDIVSNTAPSEENRIGVNRLKTYSGNLFVWVVDYAKDAQALQLSIYGHSNIEIDEDTHVSASEMVKKYISYNKPITSTGTKPVETTVVPQTEETTFSEETTVIDDDPFTFPCSEPESTTSAEESTENHIFSSPFQPPTAESTTHQEPETSLDQKTTFEQGVF